MLARAATVPSALWPLNMQLHKPKSLLTVRRFRTLFTLAELNGILNNLHHSISPIMNALSPFSSPCLPTYLVQRAAVYFETGRRESGLNVKNNTRRSGKNCSPTFL
jgi:hypothetical protein